MFKVQDCGRGNGVLSSDLFKLEPILSHGDIEAAISVESSTSIDINTTLQQRVDLIPEVSIFGKLFLFEHTNLSI